MTGAPTAIVWVFILGVNMSRYMEVRFDHLFNLGDKVTFKDNCWKYQTHNTGIIKLMHVKCNNISKTRESTKVIFYTVEVKIPYAGGFKTAVRLINEKNLVLAKE